MLSILLLWICVVSDGQTLYFLDGPSSTTPHLIGRFKLQDDSTIQDMNPWYNTITYPIDASYSHPEICSDLHFTGHHQDTGTYHFVGISDDGPQIENDDCQDQLYRPLPQHGSVISNFHLVRTNSGYGTLVEGDIRIDNWLPLQSHPAVELISLHPTKPSFFDEQCQHPIDPATFLLPVSRPADGLDPEGIVRLSSGQYLIAEEYGPSLVVVDHAGVIQMRYLPEGRHEDYVELSYPVREIFPNILKNAFGKRGFESVALSNDESTVWLFLQSPIKIAENTEIVRVVEVDVSDPLQAELVGMYFYRQTSETMWSALISLSGDGDSSMTGDMGEDYEVKIGAVEWISPGVLLVAERRDGVFVIYSVDFNSSTNVLIEHGEEAEDESNPVEQRMQELGIKPPVKTRVLSSTHLDVSDTKLEGLSILGDSTIALCYDNDLKNNAELDVVQLNVVLGLNFDVTTQQKCEDFCRPFQFAPPQYEFDSLEDSPPAPPSPKAPPSPSS